MKKSKGFDITGFLETKEEHTPEEAWDKIEAFLDSLGWYFTGVIKIAEDEVEE